MYWFITILIVLLTDVSTINTLKNESSLSKDTNSGYTLSSIDDVEMLTYFLLCRHGYFNSSSSSSSDHFVHFFDNFFDDPLDEDSLSETKLREFIEKIKINQLIPNRQSLWNVDESKMRMCSESSLNNLMKTKRWWPKYDDSKNYDKTKAICETATSCNNAKHLVNLVGLSSVQTPTLSQTIARLCPLMLFQMQDKECVDQQEHQFKAKNKPSMGAVWGFGLLFVTIVSFCSIAGVGILPFLSEYSYNIMLTVLEGLAVGSLVGSALFHLIPQAFNLMMPDNHEYLWRALIIFGGIYLFFWSERLMKIISELRKKKKSKDFSLASTTSLENDPQKLRQVHYHNRIDKEDNGQANGSMKSIETSNNHRDSSNHFDNNMSMVHVNNKIDGDDADHGKHSNALSMKHDNHHHHLNLPPNHHHHSHTHANIVSDSDEIATIAWMIIFGDGLHNFIDGVTMGAAFSQSILEGISISVAVICEEFPHELGDFAILLGSGMSMRKAFGYNFLSACTCYLGFIFGILIGDLSDATPYVFALAGGMFLYISLVDMMGELSNKLEEAGKKGLGYTLQILLLQNVGIIIGVSILFILAKYSDRINFEGLVPPKNSDIPFTDS